MCNLIFIEKDFNQNENKKVEVFEMIEKLNPIRFGFNNFGDMFFIEKASSNLVVKNLIEKFFLGEINSNEDVNNLIINNKIKINTLINDEKTLD